MYKNIVVGNHHQYSPKELQFFRNEAKRIKGTYKVIVLPEINSQTCDKKVIKQMKKFIKNEKPNKIITI